MRLRSVPIFILLLISSVALRADTTRILGRVEDSSGAAISNARVELRCSDSSHEATTSSLGTFEFADVPAKSCRLITSAPGFATAQTTAQPDTVVRLSPATDTQTVTVTASRTTLAASDIPVTALSMTRKQLTVQPALTIDDKLRQVPGFALFRRSGSQTSNPTSQGVSLRGLGDSGASRTLVMADGIPLNDPFGGWVYWGRVPLESISQIDVVEGGVSDLYGSSALAGAINIRSRPALTTAFSGESSYGTQSSPLGSFVGSAARGRWSALAAGEGFQTDGYIPVAEDQRGAVDTYANSEHRSGMLRVERRFGKDSRVFLGGDLYGESRRNGTELQVNNATVRQLQAGVDWNNRFGTLTLRGFGGTENLHQTFSSINDARSAESLVVDQRVPVSQFGLSAQWSKVLGHHVLSVGTDARHVTGDTNELHYFHGNYTYLGIAGGNQLSLGVYAEDLWQITPRWMLSSSLRADHWTNTDASSRKFPAVGAESITPYPNRSEAAFSPRVGLTRVISDGVSVYGSVYRSFRAPTLNELYRSFRVGSIVTQSNPDLKAERFTGGELGARVRVGDHVRFHTALFGGLLDDPIGNITLTRTPSLITRQRQNIGSIRLRGIEFGSEINPTKRVVFSTAYQFTDAQVFSNSSDPSLVGNMVPLVPRHAVTFAATYINPRLVTVSLQGRSNSTEYDDDLNTLPLDPYFNLGMYVAHQMRHGLKVFAAAENLLNSTYEIGRTPIPTIGAPRSVRVGLRFQFGDSSSSF